MENLRKLQEAQIALINKAVLLMQAGVDSCISTRIYPYLQELHFSFAGVEGYFKVLESETEFRKALAQLDEMIQQKKAQAFMTYEILKDC